jgi:hypothetical protein
MHKYTYMHTYTHIHKQNLDFLVTQPHMEELHLENNKLTSFRGLQLQPKLESINLKGNPICDHEVCMHGYVRVYDRNMLQLQLEICCSCKPKSRAYEHQGKSNMRS